MIQQRLPEQINYVNIIPKGFPTIYKQWNLDPMSSNKQWVNNDIVRFNMQNMGKGVFDPYRSYIQITVSCNQNDLPVGMLQMDNSAQSFIQQLVIYSNGRQIQRINDYSVLAAYLNDIGLNQTISQGRQTQGLGYGSYDTVPFNRTSSNGNSSLRSNGTGTATLTYGFGTIYPTVGNSWGQTTDNNNTNSIFSASKSCKGHVTNSNPVLSASDLNGGVIQPQQTAMQLSLAYTGYGNNIRTQYHTKFIQPKFPQHTQSIPLYQLCLSQSVSNNKFPFQYNSSIPYTPAVRSGWQQSLYFNNQNNFSTHTINCANFGFTSLFSPFFARGTFQPIISPTVAQCMLSSGVITQTKTPIYRKTFKLPLISATLGVLIDPSQFVFIPLQSVTSTMIQITLDPYAMFTSGYCDYSQFDTVGMQTQQKRCFVIQRLTYKLQTYHFLQQQVQKYIQTSLTRQITVLTNFWSMSNQYQIPGGNTPNNTYLVGCNSTHLNQLICLFVPNDYQQYSFARKHFRISNNVKKFWSKLAVDYWPPQPFKGNAGNVMSNNVDDDNSQFVQNIYWSGNYMFSKSSLPRINNYNFCINQRSYNIKNSSTFYDPSMLNNQKYTFSANSVNADTALGMCWLHQNRYIGKAAYVIDYTPFSPDDQILQGINVSQINNFQVIFQCDTTNVFSRDQTLYIFCKSSGIVKYSNNQIRTFGRG